ncbi:MAG TPA: hypothetical protein PLE48_15045 [Thiobacillus sp.]|nr:hypothetical protein [Thiobacillus sp.]
MATPICIGINNGLESTHLPSGFFEYVRSDRQQWNASIDIERPLAVFCVRLTHD